MANITKTQKQKTSSVCSAWVLETFVSLLMIDYQMAEKFFFLFQWPFRTKSADTLCHFRYELVTFSVAVLTNMPTKPK